MDPFDQWDAEFAEDEEARLERIIEDVKRDIHPSSGGAPGIEYVRRIR